ncbi:hypothetical protein PAXRUDRAFT_803773, partial [Paxillus rubicundulus Ve08.2h10]
TFASNTSPVVSNLAAVPPSSHGRRTTGLAVTIPKAKNPLKILLKRKCVETHPVIPTSNTTADHDTRITTANSVEEPEPPTPVKHKKWQPHKTKTSRTLCTYQWLKQVNPDGTAIEFTKYWKRLKQDQKVKYEKDFGLLVSVDSWNNFSAVILNKLTSRPMY